jgi:hypothetical protein
MPWSLEIWQKRSRIGATDREEDMTSCDGAPIDRSEQPSRVQLVFDRSTVRPPSVPLYVCSPMSQSVKRLTRLSVVLRDAKRRTQKTDNTAATSSHTTAQPLSFSIDYLTDYYCDGDDIQTWSRVLLFTEQDHAPSG